MTGGMLLGPLHLEGDIDLHLAEGLDARLTSVRLEDGGPQGEALRLALAGRMGELRKIARFVPSVRALLRQAEDEGDDAPARLTLQAPDEHRQRLAAATEGAPPTWAELRDHPEWMAALLDLERYTPERLEFDASR